MSRSLANALSRIDNLSPPRMPLLLSGDRRHAAPAADLSSSAASLYQTSGGVRVWETMASVSRVATASSSSSTHYAFQLATARAVGTDASSRNARGQAPSPATAPSSTTVLPALGAVPRENLHVQSAAAPSGSTAPANASWGAAQAQLRGSGPVFTPAAAPGPQMLALEVYGRDMTGAAGNTDPVVGRDDVIDRVICVLCRRSKNSVVLVGEPGVGKTAVAEGLAQRIAAGNVPASLSGARVVELDLGALMAGTTLRGMFEERVRSVIKEAEDAKGKVILFVDEMHMLLGVGANLLKPALARGRIRCVGATTLDEHRKYVERDTAFERRFQKVHVPEPSSGATIAILQGLKKKFEEHHNTIIQDTAISAAVQLADRYITGRQFPDKAIDVIDEASSITRIQADNQLKVNNRHHSPVDAVNEAVVCPDIVAQVVSQFTGIPVNALAQDEKVKLMNLANRLQERVVGQEEAVNLVSQSVLRSRTGLDQPGQPIGSFLFLGSTGVGKTELAKALAEQLFDSEKMLIRFDMTEFVGSHSVLRLIGAPPSYRGYDEGGQLTEKVRQRPYSVILFDEIEKADPAVFNLFLQILDDGVLTDGKGRTVDFKNTIIIMTSNLGAEHLMKAMTVGKSMEAARELVIKQAEKYFKPEFLNRLSEIVIFEPLSRDELRVVAYVQMKGIIARLADKGINVSASEAAIDVVLSESYNPLYGARPIRRWLQKNVMTKLSEMLVKGEVDANTTVIIDASEDKKNLRYIVMMKNACFPYKRSPLELFGDFDNDNGIDLNAPATAKKMKWI